MDDRLQFARQIAREAGDITLEFFEKSFDVERKSDKSPVTIADRNAEQHLRQRISDAFPDDGIVGEEFGVKNGSSEYRWILDPIDGTKSFISGVPLYGTLIGMEQNGASQIGVIQLPALGRSIFAAVGQGAWHTIDDGEPIAARVSDCARLEDGLLLTSEVKTFGEFGFGEVFDRLQEASWIVRTWGDCYGYYLVATGRAAAMVDPALEHWDAAALKPIMEESGGRFTDFTGEATVTGGNGIGSNGHVHAEILSAVDSV